MKSKPNGDKATAPKLGLGCTEYEDGVYDYLGYIKNNP